MKNIFFELSSDFMAIGPTGSPRWIAVNPALGARLGLTEQAAESVDIPIPSDPSHLVAPDGSGFTVDWTVREEGGMAYWVGRELKPSLVRELHHRLKNNLQFVVSLLGFQSSRLADPVLRAEFEKAESRVRAVARLHEIAYSAIDFSEVEFGAYLRQLVHNLALGETATATVEASDVALPMDQAMPLGLIAHELVSNALGNPGATAIAVSLRYEAERLLNLTVGEDGPGIESPPVGSLELLNVLVDQLGGSMSNPPGKSLTVTVIFPLKDD